MTPSKPKPSSENHWTNRFIFAVLVVIVADMAKDWYDSQKEQAVQQYRLDVAEKLLEKFNDLPPRIGALEEGFERLDERVLNIEIARVTGEL